ncbi:hypothetical protein B9Z55_020169 [Caenorhabditis nigoni]|uniref:Acyltransferase C-terminal domain-containing protein n=1 Tax=Caenorhabditis nigoni TaxID=1611254 RepID=A0A2G5TLJ2_9PELO|nr:hypothetical protein B9Z55_020169 [Caenorhabditis nigoni]
MGKTRKLCHGNGLIYYFGTKNQELWKRNPGGCNRRSHNDNYHTRPPIKYVLDVTIAYPNGIPLSLATFGLGTREKCDIAVNYKIYDAAEVPFEDEEKLRDWMYEVYKEKDEMLGISHRVPKGLVRNRAPANVRSGLRNKYQTCNDKPKKAR